MNKGITTLIIVLVILVGAVLLLRSDSKTIETEETEVMEQVEGSALSGTGTYTVDAGASSLVWSGEKPLLSQVNEGTVMLSSGSFDVKEGVVTGGTLVIDMSTIAVTSVHNGEDDDKADQLLGHLGSEDFFNVEKFKTATFAITKAEKTGDTSYTLSGDLTIKGMKKPVSFPAEVMMDGDGNVNLLAEVTIDRTMYDIKFGSGKFFEDLGDNIIADEFMVKASLVAKAPSSVMEDMDSSVKASDDSSIMSN